MHMPEAEMWTSFGKVGGKGPIRRVGVNFGAPGDRKSEEGTLWLEYPSVGGSSPTIDVHVAGKNVRYVRRHSARVEGPMNWVAASGVVGLDTFTLMVGPVKSDERSYTVRLYFSEPDNLEPGQRVFDVALQGKPVLDAFDIVKQAGGPNKSLIKEFKNVKIGHELKLLFKASAATPILGGVEIVAEGW
jgi:hypothetical protein